MFSQELNKKLDQYHLLNHPFYKSWNEGKLTREIIKDYAEQYYQHVKAFPRYISATHSICEDIDRLQRVCRSCLISWISVAALDQVINLFEFDEILDRCFAWDTATWFHGSAHQYHLPALFRSNADVNRPR